jgi:hypothetical protein
MRIVSETSETEIARERALREIDRTLREFTANVMRVTRGAGKPDAIIGEAISLFEALIGYHNATGDFPSYHRMAAMLYMESDEERINQMRGAYRPEYYAEQKIICGSLQVAASRLLGQRTLQRSGEREMYLGIRELDDIHAERQKQSAATKPRKKT